MTNICQAIKTNKHEHWSICDIKVVLKNVTDYGGAQCDDGVNMCMRLQPCENSAPCTARDGLPGFNCNCFGTGFHGKKCSTVMI